MEYILSTKNLGISFGGLKACENVNMDILPNEIYGLIGPNGAGKTTLFNIITGVYQPTWGDFYLNGERLTGLKQEKICNKGIARTFQNIRLFNNMTVIRNVMVGLTNKSEYKCTFFESMFRFRRHFKVEKEMREKAKEILDIFGLLPERNNLACNLPYGMQRKLEIARALATSPKLLLLDEPAAGMNPNETMELVETIKLIKEKFNIGILLIDHDLKFVSGLCDRITVLNFGQVLAQGKVQDVLNNKDVIEAYIGRESD